MGMRKTWGGKERFIKSFIPFLLVNISQLDERLRKEGKSNLFLFFSHYHLSKTYNNKNVFAGCSCCESQKPQKCSLKFS